MGPELCTTINFAANFCHPQCRLHPASSLRRRTVNFPGFPSTEYTNICSFPPFSFTFSGLVHVVLLPLPVPVPCACACISISIFLSILLGSWPCFFFFSFFPLTSSDRCDVHSCCISWQYLESLASTVFLVFLPHSSSECFLTSLRPLKRDCCFPAPCAGPTRLSYPW